MYFEAPVKIFSQLSDKDILECLNPVVLEKLLYIFIHTFDKLNPIEGGIPGFWGTDDCFEKFSSITARVLFCIFQKDGLAFFKKASEISYFSVAFTYMSRHLVSRPSKYHDHESFLALLKASLNLPKGVQRRYSAYRVHTVDVVINEGSPYDYIGCMNKRSECPSWSRFMGICRAIEEEKYITVIDKEFLETFGRKLKFCGGCRLKAYCSRRCQKSDWIRHRDSCRTPRLISY